MKTNLSTALHEVEVATLAMILFRNGFASTLELALFRRRLDT